MEQTVTVYCAPWSPQEGVPKCRTEHRTALGLLSRGLWEHFGLLIEPEELECRLEKGPHGKPFLPGHPDVHFNISHTDGLAVCAFSGAPVGVDVERPAPFLDILPRKALTEDEQRFLADWSVDEAARQALFFRFWTLKESLFKCSGEGLARKLTDVSFSFPRYPDTGVIECSDPGVYLVQRELADGIILSVCSAAPIGRLRLEPPMDAT